MTNPTLALDALTLELLDLSAMLNARGWSRLELRTDDFGSLTLVDERPEPGPAVPPLGVPEQGPRGALTAALGDLRGIARGLGISWPGEALSLLAPDAQGAASLVFLDDAAKPLHTHSVRAELTGELLFTEPLFAWLEDTLPRADAAQTALEALLHGHDDWGYNQNTLELALTRGQLPWRDWRASVLATWDEPSGSLLWGWANKHVSPECTQPARDLHKWAEHRPGMRAFTRPELHTDEGFAVTLAQCAAVELGARGVYRASYGPGMLYLAVE